MNTVTTPAPPRTVPPLLTPSTALFLDFDGTLAEIAAKPEMVSVREYLPGLLGNVRRRLDGAVAILSGRTLATVDEFLAPLRLPGAGLHGAELRLAENDDSLQPPPSASVRRLVHQLTRLFAEDERIVVEDKGAAVALHFRLAPERLQDCDAAMQTLAAHAEDLEVIRGSMVVEARLRGFDKGTAMRRLLKAGNFSGRRPVVLGDDLTDEDAFNAARKLGGYSIKVGKGASTADFRLNNPANVHAWLSQSVLALEMS